MTESKHCFFEEDLINLIEQSIHFLPIKVSPEILGLTILTICSAANNDGMMVKNDPSIIAINKRDFNNDFEFHLVDLDEITSEIKKLDPKKRLLG